MKKHILDKYKYSVDFPYCLFILLSAKRDIPIIKK